MADRLYERVRFRDVLPDGQIVELDAIHARTSLWAEVLTDEPSFAGWRVGHLPSGWTIAIEPVSVTLPRFLASARPDRLGGLVGRG